MKVEGLDRVWLYLLVVVLASAAQIRAKASVVPPISTSTSVPQDLGDGEQAAHGVTEATAFNNTEEHTTATVITPVSTTQAGEVPTTASESPSVTPTPLSTSTTQTPGHTFSSQPASSSPGSTPCPLSSTEPLLVSLTTASATATIQPQGIAGSTHQDVPSQLNVGDEDFKGRSHRPNSLDPLLAGLLSVFIVTTAVVFVVLFLKFRHQNSNPEFHRLQDLPMDDLMEDTPLSRYTY